MQQQMPMQVLSQPEQPEPETLQSQDFRIAESFLIGRTSITLTVVFDHFACNRNESQFPADILLANQDHLRTADRADLVFYRKKADYFFNLQSFEEIIMSCLLFTDMLSDHRFFFRQRWTPLYFHSIKEILLSQNVIGSSFAGGAEKLLVR